jgi:hypothetical protein
MKRRERRREPSRVIIFKFNRINNMHLSFSSLISPLSSLHQLDPPCLGFRWEGERGEGEGGREREREEGR